jgi:hypothetical protein
LLRLVGNMAEFRDFGFTLNAQLPTIYGIGCIA